MHRNQSGFSLTELLLSIVISSIILGAAFGSYAIINRNFEYQNDMRHISQTARMVVDIINKDIRMAGYKDPAAANIASTDAISITECPGGTGCSQQTGSLDQITVIYDKSPTVRHKIRYYATAYPSGTLSTDRYRLMKRLDTCNPSASACSSDANFTNQYDEPIADYIEELSFVGYRNSIISSTGALMCGQGNRRDIYSPISASSSCPNSSNEMNAFDGSPATYWTATTIPGGTCFLDFSFANEVEIVKMQLQTAAHIDGGSINLNNHDITDNAYNTAVHPYGTTLPAKVGTRLMMKDPTHCVRCDDDQGPGSGNSCTSFDASFADKPIRFMGTSSECDIQTHLNGFAAGESNKWCFMGGDGGQIQQNASKNWQLRINNPNDDVGNTGAMVCEYSGEGATGCNLTETNTQAIAEINFIVNVFGEVQIPYEIETTVLIRSSNSHGNVDRINGFNSKTDRYLRDKFIGSVLIRNLHYQGQ